MLACFENTSSEWPQARKAPAGRAGLECLLAAVSDEAIPTVSPQEGQACAKLAKVDVSSFGSLPEALAS